WFDELNTDFPKSYEKYDDLLLVPHQCLNHSLWEDPENLKLLVSSFKCNRLAKKGPISNDKFRTPQVTMLLGDNSVVRHIDNKIIYQYDVQKCMYSPGNITEKLRISQMDCRNEVIVDLYAGIGYFTLPFMVHGKASHVYACEWNPDAVEALKNNLALNGVEDRCTVLQGDNNEMCPTNVADRVNLGLIPSSRDGWNVACKALKRNKGGVLHIHENVTDDRITNHPNCNERDRIYFDVETTGTKRESKYCSNNGIRKDKNMKEVWIRWANDTCKIIQDTLEKLDDRPKRWQCEVLYIGQIKSYAPHIDHLVVDVHCKPIL
ncbi:hypothetical protein HELRODRAFT_67136, partial [Helobdella robusta]|uniref:tRNA(Phe) (4-demethylwyosine(37)-C(7)) aminocarboxypropyltransferase n=1 Tax=Helobdella robusta TaxID=6412 RepID=T1FYX2_HELRO